MSCYPRKDKAREVYSIIKHKPTSPVSQTRTSSSNELALQLRGRSSPAGAAEIINAALKRATNNKAKSALNFGSVGGKMPTMPAASGANHRVQKTNMALQFDGDKQRLPAPTQTQEEPQKQLQQRQQQTAPRLLKVQDFTEEHHYCRRQRLDAAASAIAAAAAVSAWNVVDDEIKSVMNYNKSGSFQSSSDDQSMCTLARSFSPPVAANEIVCQMMPMIRTAVRTQTAEGCTNTVHVPSTKLTTVNNSSTTQTDCREIEDLAMCEFAQRIFKDFLLQFKDCRQGFMSKLNEISLLDIGPVSRTIILLAALKEIVADLQQETSLTVPVPVPVPVPMPKMNVEEQIKQEDHQIEATTIFKKSDTRANRRSNCPPVRRQPMQTAPDRRHHKSCACLDCIVNEVYIPASKASQDSWLEGGYHPQPGVVRCPSCTLTPCLGSSTTTRLPVNGKHSSQCCCIDCITRV